MYTHIHNMIELVVLNGFFFLCNLLVSPNSCLSVFDMEKNDTFANWLRLSFLFLYIRTSFFLLLFLSNCFSIFYFSKQNKKNERVYSVSSFVFLYEEKVDQKMTRSRFPNLDCLKMKIVNKQTKNHCCHS